MPFDANDPETKEAVAAMIAEATAPLLAHQKKLLGELKVAKRGAEVDPADVERLENELEAANAKLADANKQLKVATTTAEKATQALDAEQKHTQRLLIDNGLNEALTGAGVKDPLLLKAAAALLRETGKPIVSADGENRVAMIGDKPLSQFVKDWAAGDEGKSFVAAPGNTGGGAPGGSGAGGPVNPFAPATKNSTAQGKLYNENPTLARQMAAEHGITLE